MADSGEQQHEQEQGQQQETQQQEQQETNAFAPVTSQEQFDRMVRDRIARERGKFSDYDDLKKKAGEFDKLQESQKTELEKERAAREAAEADREKVVSESRETRLRAAMIAEAAKPARKVVDIDAAIALIPRDELTLDDEGNPTNIAEAMDSLLAAKPYLVAANGGTRPNEADQGARGGGDDKQISREALQTMSPEAIRDALRKGELNTVIKGG